MKNPTIAVTSEVIKRELFASLPAPSYISWYARSNVRKCQNIVSNYFQKSISCIQKFQNSISKEEYGEMRKCAQSSLNVVRSSRDPKQIILELTQFQEKYSDIIKKQFQPLVEEICKNVQINGQKAIDEVIFFKYIYKRDLISFFQNLT